MKNVSTFLGITGILASSLVIGCAKKTDSSNSTTATTRFKMAGSANSATVAKTNFEKFLNKLLPSAQANAPMNMLSKDNQSVTLSSLWVVLKEIEFKSAETAGEEAEDEKTENSSFHGPYVADLLAANPVVLDTQNITSKTYKRIKMQYEKVDTSVLLAKAPTAPAALANNSIYLEGSYCSSASCTFTYKLDDGVEIEIAGPNGIAAQDGQDMLVSIQLANVIRQIDFTVLSAAADKNINHTNRVTGANICDAIDPSATDYYTCIRKGLEKEAHLGKDDNGDGEINGSEQSVE
jgi:hypothetical protein